MTTEHPTPPTADDGPNAERFRRIAEHSSDAVYETDAEGRVVWASGSLGRFTGLSAEEVIGRRIVEFLAPGQTEAVAARRRRVLEDGTIERMDMRLAVADGDPRWVSAQAVPLVDAEGRVTGAVVSLRDVDDERRARESLEVAERRYRALAEGGADVVAEARGGVMTWCSDSVTDLLGWRPDDLIGRDPAELVHAEDRSRLDDALTQDLPTPREFVGRFRASNGSYRWLSSRVRDIVGTDGEPMRIACWRDITEPMHALDALLASEARLRATVDSMLSPHVVLTAVRDDDGTIVDFVFADANDAAVEYMGLGRADLLGLRVLDLLPGQAASGLLDRYIDVVETGEPFVAADFVYDVEVLGAKRRFDIRATRLDDGLSFTWNDVTEAHEQQERLEEQATRDALTGLANRAELISDLERALSSSLRSGLPVAVLMADLDHFKYVNDTLGHAVGDTLLVHAARRIEDCVRAGDLIARLGGDEFVVVMREVADPEVAVRAAQRINEAFRRPMTDGDADLYTTASIGIALSTPSSTPPDMLRESDTAMYRAKEQGRDRSTIFNDELRVAVTARLDLEGKLRVALERGELEVWYQPEVDLRSRAVTAVEALLRWHHPSGELYTADRFIEAAEDTGLISDIGAWVVDEACARAAEWGDPTRPPLTVRINLSAYQLSDPGLVDMVRAAVCRHAVDPHHLCLEITETALMRDTAVARENLAALHRDGFQLAVDDFGTGYASLSYLRDHPIDVVKIDRGFVHSMWREFRSRSLISGIIALAEHIGVDVVAEGVEHEDDAHALVEFGCHRAQGWLFSPAIPASEVADLLAGGATLGSGGGQSA